LFERSVEGDGILETLQELGIGFYVYSATGGDFFRRYSKF